jgi:hypothetical protein
MENVAHMGEVINAFKNFGGELEERRPWLRREDNIKMDL